MNDLARQRRDHDIWVSRSHLYALGVGMVLFAVACFALGYTAGRRSVDRFEPTTSARLQDQPADDGLVELLARVDAAATPDGGLRKLTFPQALEGQGGDVEVPTLAPAAGVIEVPGAGAVELEAPASVPKGSWTVAVASLPDRPEAEAVAANLTARGIESWIGTERIEGVTAYRLAIGAYASRAEAEEALGKLDAGLGTLEVVRY